MSMFRPYPKTKGRTHGKRPATPEEMEHMGRVRGLRCIACKRAGRVQTSITEAHHIKRDPLTGQSLGGSQKGDGFTTIPLCQRRCHWNGVYVSIGSREFEAENGNEIDLLVETYADLGIAYPYPYPLEAA